ncbi:MAG TPA: hypothetical protein VK537_04690 [Galbitalea sp.]|nr:hypothetical protein [Galbitalea sp.]
MIYLRRRVRIDLVKDRRKRRVNGRREGVETIPDRSPPCSGKAITVFVEQLPWSFSSS